MMIQNTQLPDDRTLDQASTPVNGRARPRRNLLRWIGGGCLSIIVLIITGFVVLYFTGILSGPHGNKDDHPAWSPDGSRIVFESDRDGNYDIFVMNADGSQIRQLTRNPFGRVEEFFAKSPGDISPAWSPDGNQIVFSSGRDDAMWSFDAFNIYVMNADGSNVKNLTNFNNIANWPAWSPDGNKIAFAFSQMFSSSGLNPFPNYDIYVMDSDGSNLVQLTHGPEEDIAPTWSPDGTYIAYMSAYPNKSQIYVMNADGSDLLPLTNNSANDGFPEWSPDGRHIAFLSDRDGSIRIYIMNSDGSNMSPLPCDTINSTYFAWTPDSNRIVYAIERSGKTGINVMNIDCTNLVQLTGN
jgi:Tol biopolymer transport system component